MRGASERSLQASPIDHITCAMQSSTGVCAGLPADCALKTAQTGVELLLSRAQLWQTTAARHVSLASELQPLAALAAR